MKSLHRHIATAGMALVLTALAGCAPPVTQPVTTASADDLQMTALVKTAIMNDAIYRVNQIRVETFNGVVQLSGTVGTTTESLHVVEMTRTIGGVRDIRNNLEIR